MRVLGGGGHPLSLFLPGCLKFKKQIVHNFIILKNFMERGFLKLVQLTFVDTDSYRVPCLLPIILWLSCIFYFYFSEYEYVWEEGDGTTDSPGLPLPGTQFF